ncbi:MAG: hypothetical protein ACRDIX_00585 [Actinomycetota bacterium]
MGHTHPEEGTTSRTSPPTGAIVAGVGGLVALLGVFLSWANLSWSLEGGQFAGQQFPAANQSQAASGLSHWTGILALVAGVVAVAAAIGIAVLQDQPTRRMAAMAALGGGAVAVLMAILGVLMSESIALNKVPGGKEALDLAQEFAQQLGVEGFGIRTGPALGVFVTAAGGVLAAVGGFMALGAVGSEGAGRAEQPSSAGTGFEAPTGPPASHTTVSPQPPPTPPVEPPKPGDSTA